jgi:hypothetical protein
VGLLGVLVACFAFVASVKTTLATNERKAALQAVPPKTTQDEWREFLAQEEGSDIRTYLTQKDPRKFAALVAKHIADSRVEMQSLALKWAPRLVQGARIARNFGNVRTATEAAEQAVRLDPHYYRGVSLLMFLYAVQHDKRAFRMAQDYEPQLRILRTADPAAYVQFLTDLASVHSIWGDDQSVGARGESYAQELRGQVITLADNAITWRERAPAILAFVASTCRRKAVSESKQAYQYNETVIDGARAAGDSFYLMKALLARTRWRSTFGSESTVVAVQGDDVSKQIESDIDEASRLAAREGLDAVLAECHLERMDMCLRHDDIDSATAEAKTAYELAATLDDAHLQCQTAQAYSTMLIASGHPDQVDSVLDSVWPKLLEQSVSVQAALNGIRGFCASKDDDAQRYLNEAARLYTLIGQLDQAERSREWARNPPHGRRPESTDKR